MREKTSVLFVCMGNICRSPAAQAVFQGYVDAAQMTDAFEVDSAGTISYHAGELPDSRMRAHAARRGLNLTHRARQIRPSDFDRFDVILTMDEGNYDDVCALASTYESMQKVRRMSDFCQRYQADCVPDPYYGGAQGFENVLDILYDACKGLLDWLLHESV